MRWIPALLTLFTVLLVNAIMWSAPLIVLGLLVRRRVGRRYIQAVLALAFAASTAYFIWRMEWFDMWRHGVPPIGYIVTAFGPYTTAVALVGWFLGGLIAGPRKKVLLESRA
jgi:hypothetical protein